MDFANSRGNKLGPASLSAAQIESFRISQFVEWKHAKIFVKALLELLRRDTGLVECRPLVAEAADCRFINICGRASHDDVVVARRSFTETRRFSHRSAIAGSE